MARHRRTVPDSRGRTNRRGYVRRVRRPAGTAARAPIAARAHRERPRALLNSRLSTERDPLKRVELALGYLRSAVKKYEPRPELLGRAERALIRAGDQYFAGRRLPAARIADNRNRT